MAAEGVDLPMATDWFAQLAQVTVDAAALRDSEGGAGPARSRTPDAGHGAPRAAPLSPALEGALLLADDATLRSLNRDYRSVDRPTDVLAFAQLEGAPLPDRPPDRPQHLGDIAISVERARRQAVEYGHSVERELGYLLVHGLLHLLGYDHEVEDERAAMREVEEAALATAGLGRGPV